MAGRDEGQAMEGAALAQAWEVVRTGLRRDCGARTFDHWLKPIGLGKFLSLIHI